MNMMKTAQEWLKCWMKSVPSLVIESSPMKLVSM